MAFSMRISFQQAGFVMTIFNFCIGALSWAIVEYVLHRFVFHMQTSTTLWSIHLFYSLGIFYLFDC